MKIDTSIECISFEHILSKSIDVSTTNYCVFGLLKRFLSKSKCTTGKLFVRNENQCLGKKLRKAFLSWKLRCKRVV